MSKERRLGRGLEALLGRPLGTTADAPEGELIVPRAARVADPGPAARPDCGLVQLSVHEIDSNPFQPRTDFDEASLAELAASIKEHGLVQSLVVRRSGSRYQLIAGERRLRAAIQAGCTEVPCLVRAADDRQVAELAIVENLQRKDLGALEKAASFHQYLERYRCTQEELAQRLSIDRSTIANLIRLLELPEGVQGALRGGTITPGHARALLPLGDEHEQLAFCRRIVAESLSVRATEELVQEMIHQADGEPLGVVSAAGPAARPGKTRNAQLSALEQELRSALGVKVELKQTATGRGRITIHFSSHEEFARLREHFSGHKVRSQAG